jgi:lysophospholipase L1-like esterase
MRKVLIASGDSWTDPGYSSHAHPDMDCSWPHWPELLAEKLDMDCINLGYSGAGNKHIYTSLVDQIQIMDPNDIGFVMAGWSQAQRIDIKVRDVWKNVDTPPQNPSYTVHDIARYGDITHRVEESIMLYYSLQEICKSKNIPLMQVQMIPIFQGYNWNMITMQRDEPDATSEETLLHTIFNSIYIDTIDDTFIGWPTELSIGGFNIQMKVLGGDRLDLNDYRMQYVISRYDDHPNAKGQIKIAEFLYEKI